MALELQFASSLVATRNGRAQPPPIGAPRTLELPLKSTDFSLQLTQLTHNFCYRPVVCYYGDFGFYSFLVEGSVDGKDWLLLSDQRHNIEQSTIKGYESAFAPRSLRYLRVRYAHDSANEGFRLIEVMAYKK